MEKLLDCLDKYIEEQEFEFRFNLPASPGKILAVQKSLNIFLPQSYRMFLARHNGGFICNGHLGEYIWETGNEDFARERSVYLFSIEELKTQYVNYRKLGRKIKFDERIRPRYPIAFACVEDGDLLAFNASQSEDNESPVYYLPQVHRVRSPKISFSNFREFLKVYIDKEGCINDCLQVDSDH